ncbi:MAG TPA: SDR family oxidoreductase [Candidatus Dormibacteraeota bacterium]|nr:SDR family oxidoreductase [Candidatus Dormibacteraeota bacterium]
MNQLADARAIVVGASRGLGRGVAEAFLAEGASVVAVARDTSPLSTFAAGHKHLQLEPGDATEPGLASKLLRQYRPDIVALVAGAAPSMRPLHLQTWESFSLNWNTDVQMTFYWLREALLLPLRPGSRIIVMSSGAAIMGSPLSGGYAGAKATQRFMADYAAQEARRGDLQIMVSAVLPRLTPLTDLGRAATVAYADRMGVGEEEYLRQLGKPVTPEIAGRAFVSIATGGEAAGAHMLTADGLQPLPGAAPVDRQPPVHALKEKR